MGYNSALMNFISPYTFSRSFPFARYVRKNDTFSFGGFLGVVGGSLGVFGGCFVILGVLGGPSSFGGFLGVVVTLNTRVTQHYIHIFNSLNQAKMVYLYTLKCIFEWQKY